MQLSKTTKTAGKRMIALALVLCMILGLFVGSVSAVSDDLTGHWAAKQVRAWMDQGLITGYSDGTFRPDNQITRGEFSAIVNRVFAYTEAGDAVFTDVPETHWAHDHVAIAANAGYMTGLGDGTFGVDKPITRQEMAVVLARLLELDTPATDSDYKDADTFASWAAASIAALAENGAMKGYPNGTFRPLNNVTRAEAVTALDKIMPAEITDAAEEADEIDEVPSKTEKEETVEKEEKPEVKEEEKVEEKEEEKTPVASQPSEDKTEVQDSVEQQAAARPQISLPSSTIRPMLPNGVGNDSDTSFESTGSRVPVSTGYGNYLVYEGHANANIVIPEGSDGLVVQGAEEIQLHTELVTGAKLSIDELNLEEGEFSASYAPSVVAAAEKGYYPVEFTLRNPTANDMNIVLRQVSDGEVEPTITIRGDNGYDGTVILPAYNSMVVTGLVTIEDEDNYGFCDIDVEVVSDGVVLDTLSVPVSARGMYTFEDGLNGWTGATVAAEAKKGDKSMAIAGTTEAILDKELVLRTGALYYLGFWAKADADDAKLYAKITDFDADGNVLDVPMSLYNRADLPNGEWTYYEYRFIANPAKVEAYASSVLSFETVSAGNIYVDEFTLIDCNSSPLSTSDEVVDGDFEDGIVKVWAGDDRDIVTDDAYSGNASLQLRTNGLSKTGTNSLMTQGLSDTMTVSFWMKGRAGDKMTLQMRYWGAVEGTDGGSIDHTSYTFTLSDKWERYEFTYYRPENETHLLIYFVRNRTSHSTDMTRLDLLNFYDSIAADGVSDYAPLPSTDAAVDPASGTKYSFEVGSQGWKGGAVTKAEAKNGSYSLKVGGNTNAVLDKELELKSGYLYQLGFWAKADADNASIYAKVADFDAEGNALAIPMSVYTKKTIAKGDWNYYEYRFVANERANEAYAKSVLTLEASSSGSIYLDDLTLASCSAKPLNQFEFIMDSDFEDGNINGWSGGVYRELKTDDAYSGSNSMWLKAWKSYCAVNNNSPITGLSNSMTFSFWAKGTAGDIMTVDLGYWTGKVTTAESHTITLSNNWERYEFTYVKPAGSSHFFVTYSLDESTCTYSTTRVDTISFFDSSAVMDLTDEVMVEADPVETDVARGDKYTFETDAEGWTGGTVTADQYKNGAQSLKVAAGTAAAFGENLELTSGALYRLGFWAKGTAGAKVYAKVADFDANGAALDVPMTVYNRADISGSDWTYYEYRFVANAKGDTDYSYSKLSLAAVSADVYLDDIGLVYCATMPTDKFAPVSANDFEDGVDGWNGNNYREVATDTAYSGTKSLWIKAWKQSTLTGIRGMSGLSNSMTLSFWAKGTAGDILTVEMEYWSNKAEGTTSHNITMTGDWERYEITCETPAGATQVYMKIRLDENTCTYGTTRVDLFTFIDSATAANLGDEVFEVPEVIIPAPGEGEGEGGETGGEGSEPEEPVVPEEPEEPEEPEVPLGEMPEILAPVNAKLTILIATTDTYPNLAKLFPDDIKFLGDSDGFAVRQRGGTIYIFGTEPRGALNGAYDFIEENLGVIWFRADDTAYDPMETVNPKRVNYREKSPFEMRCFHVTGNGDNNEPHSDPDTEIMMTRNKHNFKTCEVYNRIYWPWQQSIGIDSFVGGHNVTTLIKDSPLYDPNETEYWCTDEDGNVMPDYDDPILCEINYWSEKAIECSIATLLKEIEQNPQLKFFSVAVNDSGYYYVKGKSDQPFEYEPGKFVYPEDENFMSTVCWVYVNRIAKAVGEVYPDVLIRGSAYHHSFPAPACDIEDNVMVMFASTDENLKDPIYSTRKGDPNIAIYENLVKWTEKTTKIAPYNYYGTSLAEHMYPRPIWDRVQSDMQLYASMGLLGVMQETIPDSNSEDTADKNDWDMNHLGLWLVSKLMWDPYLDLDETIEYYCNKVYGPESGPYMLQFYTLVKEGWDDSNAFVHYADLSTKYVEDFVLSTGKKQAEMANALQLAMNAATGVYVDRISYIYGTFTAMLEAAGAMKIEESATATYTTAGKDAILATIDYTDPIWADAQVIDNTFDSQRLTPVAGAHTEVRLLWDEDYLYVGYACYDDTIGNIKTTDKYSDSTNSWWGTKSDDVETFITLDPSLNHYYAYFNNPSNLYARWQIKNNYRNQISTAANWDWNNVIVDKEGTEEDMWVVIQAISWESMGLSGKASSNTGVWAYFWRQFYDEDMRHHGISWNGAWVWTAAALKSIILLPAE